MGWGVPEQGWRKGPWIPEEDKLLSEYVKLHGEGRWSSVSRCAGLNRSGKSCRLRWVNYLRPGLKRGQITPQEEGIIIELHALWGNKWSTIARYLPGRTDNEIKNYWRTHFKKKERKSEKNKKANSKVVVMNNNSNQELQKQKEEEEEHKQLGNEMKIVSDDEKMDQGTVMMNQADHNMNMASWTEFMMDDGFLWGGLWNLDYDYDYYYH